MLEYLLRLLLLERLADLEREWDLLSALVFLLCSK